MRNLITTIIVTMAIGTSAIAWGGSSTQIGNTMYHSNGTSSTQIGNTTYHSAGGSSTRIGNTIYHNGF